MRIAILGDIHANLEALEAVLADARSHEVGGFACVGDVVGYNADPSECLRLVRERCSHVIAGNHERMVLGASLYGVRKEALEATEWTRNQLTSDELRYIEELPDDARVGNTILLVHGSPRDKDEYILSTDAIRENLQTLRMHYPETRVCFFGHSHCPMVIGAPEVHTRFHETRRLDLDRSRVYLINPGSVGQPRDACPNASCAVFDDEAFVVTIYRLPYDIATTQKKVIGAGLDRKLAARLDLGK